MDQAVQTLLDKQAIYELSCRYMRGLDRLDAALLQSVFWDNAYCEYGFINGDAASFIEFAVGALKDHASNQHMIGNTLIDVEGDEAFGEVYFHAYHKVKSDTGFDDLIVAGRYLDRYERRDGVWKMAYRSERVDWSRTTPTQDPYYQMMPDSLFGSRLDDAVYDRNPGQDPIPDIPKWPGPWCRSAFRAPDAGPQRTRARLPMADSQTVCQGERGVCRRVRS